MDYSSNTWSSWRGRLGRDVGYNDCRYEGIWLENCGIYIETMLIWIRFLGTDWHISLDFFCTHTKKSNTLLPWKPSHFPPLCKIFSYKPFPFSFHYVSFKLILKFTYLICKCILLLGTAPRWSRYKHEIFNY